MKRRALLVSGLAGMAGCLGPEISRSGGDETAPAVRAIRFRNRHDRPHELTAAFTADGEVLFVHTASLAPYDAGTAPSSTVRPEIPERNWLFHGRIDGREPRQPVAQGRVEYARVDILCRVSRRGALRVRFENAD